MTERTNVPAFEVEPLGEGRGLCDCCGSQSKSVWGAVHRGAAAVAAYWVHWAEGHLGEPGANLDLVMGRWGDDTSAVDRFGIALRHRELADGTSALMVIDAVGRPMCDGTLAGSGLARDEVIGTPLAAQVFAIVDAIYEQDSRFF